jgi:hypothetical protein
MTIIIFEKHNKHLTKTNSKLNKPLEQTRWMWKPRRRRQLIQLLGWYVLWGVIHELFHVVTYHGLVRIAAVLMAAKRNEMRMTMTYYNSTSSLRLAEEHDNEPFFASGTHVRVWSLVGQILFGKCYTVNVERNDYQSAQAQHSSSDANYDYDLLLEWIVFGTTHVGWLGSVTLALLLHFFSAPVKQQQQQSNASSKKKNETTFGGCVIEKDSSIGGGCKDENSRSESFTGKLARKLSWCGAGVGRIPEEAVFAAYVVALEAISTDLLGLVPHYCQQLSATTSSTTTTTIRFFCGNFGLILLNNDWICHDGGVRALDMLQEMINVTMMRGAQSGGVVTFLKKTITSKDKSPHSIVAAQRCRTVNPKRGDLAIRVRRKLAQDVCLWNSGGKLKAYKGYPFFTRVFYGHTRFATTSKANLDGCHPQQWTPASLRRVYHPFVSHKDHSRKTKQRKRKNNQQPSRIRPAAQTVCRHPISVANFVTHNGDLDFFVVRGKSYDSLQIQKWLPLATGAPMVSNVDSAAIAGLVDLIRAQGCFALSARFAICFALRSSKIEPAPPQPLPTYQQYETLGRIFEHALQVLLQKYGKINKQKNEPPLKILDIASNTASRQELCELVLRNPSLVEYADLEDNRTIGCKSNTTTNNNNYNQSENGVRLAYQSIRRFIDAEGGSSISAFVKVTVDAFFDNDLLETAKFFLKHAKGSFGLSISSTLDAHRQVCLAAKGQPMSVAFYQKTGLVCYASEQAALKAGMGVAVPIAGGGLSDQTSIKLSQLNGDDEEENNSMLKEAWRLDLDDLGGEICLLDWGCEGVEDYSEDGRVTFDHGCSSFDSSDAEEDADPHIDATHHIRNNVEQPGISRSATDATTNPQKKNKHNTVHEAPDFGVLAISPPNRRLPVHSLMKGGSLKVVLLNQSEAATSLDHLRQRMTLLEGNDLIRPLTGLGLKEKKSVYKNDPILKDIHDIPRVCAAIQEDWRALSLNRLTAWHLQTCIQQRMDDLVSKRRKRGGVDILVTGCEVSLWVGEQFASDLQKALPKLGVLAVSSNKLLGLLGQGLSIPCVGFPLQETLSRDLQDVIVIIVSHSGGTFAPLACSNLLQSMTKNIFVVSSEWDTQIGKQLRSMHERGPNDNDRPRSGHHHLLQSSRIFSTGVGVRPAEPCSVSVVATHQLLTQIFQHICLTVIGNPNYRRVSAAAITEYDLQVLETLNRDNIQALEDIVGMDAAGYPVDEASTTKDLRMLGNLWADHVLEQAKAYILTFIYVFVTVTSGYPIVSGISLAFGMTTNNWAFYLSEYCFVAACEKPMTESSMQLTAFISKHAHSRIIRSLRPF